jgi:imidazolonepropionase-like amidohydrolase
MLGVRAERVFNGVSSVAGRPLVLIDGQRVAAVQADGGQPPAGIEVIDLGAATLLPGLVEAHLHLAFDASDDPVGRLAAAGDEEVLGRMRVAARSCLDAGITTVRDLGDRGYLALRLRDEFASDLTAGPHVVAAGPPITTPRGTAGTSAEKPKEPMASAPRSGRTPSGASTSSRSWPAAGA